MSITLTIISVREITINKPVLSVNIPNYLCILKLLHSLETFVCPGDINIFGILVIIRLVGAATSCH